MHNQKQEFVEIITVQGELTASVLKTHLESEGIPVLLKYESIGKVIGILANGLGEVKILVPEALAEEAREIIKPQTL